MAPAFLFLFGFTLATGDPAAVTATEESEAASPTRRPYLFDVDLSLRITARRNEPQTALLLSDMPGDALPLQWNAAGLLLPQSRRVYPSAVLSIGGEAEPLTGVNVKALLDSGELRSGASLDPKVSDKITADGGEVSSWFTSGAFVRELAFSFAGRWGAFTLGRRLASVGDGLVYEDFGTGVSLSLDLEDTRSPITHIEALLFAVGHTFDTLASPSPMLTLKLTHSLSMFESIELFGSVYWERDGTLRDVLTSVVSERVIANNQGLMEQARLTQLFFVDRPSDGRLFYLGTTGNWLPAAGLSLRAAIVGAAGRITVSSPTQSYLFDLRGWATALDASYGLSPSLGLGATLLYLSGDNPPKLTSTTPQRYHSFIGIAPYWAWTGLFFSGGLNQGLFPGRAAAAGVDGRGVDGGAVRGEWSGDTLRATLSAAFLWGPAGPPLKELSGGGSFYGVETDLVVEWTLVELVGIGVEGDLFRPGSFFRRHDLAYRAVAQVRLHAGS